MLGANRPATTDFWLLFVGYQGGKPILIVTDSIGKALPSHKNWRHELMTGKTFTNVTDSIYNRTILIGGVRVVVIHMGTNSIYYRVWGRGGAGKWENQLEAIKGEVSSLFRAIRSFNATCFMYFQRFCHANVIGSTLRPCTGGSTPSWVVLARDAQWGTSLLGWTKGCISTCQADISWQRGSGWH